MEVDLRESAKGANRAKAFRSLAPLARLAQGKICC